MQLNVSMLYRGGRMKRIKKQGSSRFVVATLAWATVFALGAALPVRAQDVSWSGDVSPVFTPGSNVNLAGQRVFLGFTNTVTNTGTLGSLSITGGGVLTAAQIVPGIGGLGVGTVSVSGAGSVINLTGGNSNNGLDIGSWGTGTVTVSNGGAIACASTLACQFNNIGNAAGSTGTLAINGGSVSGLGRLFVGSGTLLAGFGTPGADTSATLTITNSGTLTSTGSSSVAGNSGQTGLVSGTVTINGPGSTWGITRDLANGGGQAFLNLAPTANSVANVTISNGGNLTVTGSRSAPATDNSLPGIQLSPGAGGTSTMTVTTGGSVRIGGDTGVLNVGGSVSANSAGASAALNITAGGTVSGTGPNGLNYMAIGRNQATGTVNVSGAGSQLTVAGVGGVNTQGLDGAGGLIDVGRNQGFGGGTGTLNVTNGGSVLISDNGLAASNGGPRLRVASGAGSTGTVLVSGLGSSIIVSSTGGGSAVPGLRIGEGGTGQMTISDSGSVSVLGSRQRDFIVGNSATGSGTLNVTTGGQINASWFGVGNNGGSGVATIDNSTISLDGFVDFGTGIGAAVRVGRGTGSTGVLNLQNGAAINIANSLPDSSVLIGGTGVAPGGTGTINMSGGSTITFTGAATGATLGVGGPSGSGLMNMSGASIVDTGATGSVQVGSSTGSSGNLTIAGGSKVFANTGGIGGNSATAAGGTGGVIVTGVGSQLKLAGDTGFLGIGSNGSGSLTVSNKGEVAATIITVGRVGGVGTMSVNDGVINLSGQQPTGGQFGAGLAIGSVGTGSASITNGSVVTITNTGSAGAHLYVGGTPSNPTGNGTLTVSNSQINVLGALPPPPVAGQIPTPGSAQVIVGYAGSASATLNNSKLQVGNLTVLNDAGVLINGGDGSLIVARQPGSTGVLSINGGSIVNAGYIGVGVSGPGVIGAGGSVTQSIGGSGQLILNNSTINTTTLEIGALGTLSGDGGVIYAAGGVIVGGTLSPGNSPGRININCDLLFLPGSRLILDILANGSGGFDVDQLILGPTATFDFANVEVDFNFLGNTDPNAFLASGKFTLDTFLKSGDLDNSNPLAGATGKAWSDLFSADQFVASSDAYNFNNFSFTPPGAGGSGGGVSFTAAAVPEPPTWAIVFIAMLLLGMMSRPRQRAVRRG